MSFLVSTLMQYVPAVDPLWLGSRGYRTAVVLRTLHALITRGVIFMGLVLYLNDRGSTISAVALISTVYFAPQLICAPLAGSLSDAMGHSRLWLAGSFLTGGLLFFLYPLTGSTIVILGVRCLQGVVEAAIRPLTQAFASEESAMQDRGNRVGLFKIVVFTGASLGPLVTGYLIEGLGFDSLFYIGGGMMIAAAFMAFILIPPGHRDTRSTERDHRPETPMRFRDHLLNNPLLNHLSGRGPTLFSVSKHRSDNASFFLLIAFIRRFAFHMFILFIPVYFLTTVGISESAIGNLEFLRRFLIVVAIVLSGTLADREGRRPLLIAASLSFLGPLLYVGFPSLTGILLAAPILGVTIGAFNPTAITYMADMAHPGGHGTYLGALESVSSLSRVLGPIAAGIIAEWAGIRWVFLAAGILMSVTFPMSFFLKETLRSGGSPEPEPPRN